MGVPRCHRCGAHSYQGEIKMSNRTFSLCGYCLPIVEGKIEGFIEDNLRADQEQTDRPDVHNVFADDKGAF